MVGIAQSDYQTDGFKLVGAARNIAPSGAKTRRNYGYTEGSGRLGFDSQEALLKMRCTVKDTSTRKWNELMLRENEQIFRGTFEPAAVGIVHTSLDGQILRSNARFAEIIGYNLDEIPGIKIQQITAPDDLGKSNEALKRITAGIANLAYPSIWEKRYIRKDGGLIWVKLTVSVKRDADGRALHYITVVQDINTSKLAEGQLATVQDALRASEERYRTTFQMSIDAVSINRLSDGVYIDANKAFLDIVGYELQEVIGQSSLGLGIWASPCDRLKLLEELRLNSFCHNLETKFRKKNGDIFWGLMSASVIEIDGISCVLSVSRDISETKAADERLVVAVEALRTSEVRYRTVFQTSFDGILINRLDNGKCIDVNHAFLNSVGFERHEVLGKTVQELGIWADPQERVNLFEILRHDSSCHAFEARFRKKSGEILWGMLSATVTQIDGVPCLISITRDISDAKAAEGEIRNLAFYDQLTGLPNRRLLLDRLHQTPTANTRFSRKRALLFVDLDNFKGLNETLGHQTGDLLLQQVALRLVACIRESDTVARLGGDEFVVLLEDLNAVPNVADSQAQAIGEKILAAINHPYWLGGRECLTTSSIGITIFGYERESTDEVLQQVDIAMYQAKAAGRNAIRFFAPALQTAVNVRAALEVDLRQALKTEQFVLYYQPQVDSAGLVGAEALIRWKHPSRGLLAPGEFIPLAEQTGLILPLGKWVLETACTLIATWASRIQTAHLSASVNVSALQFRQPDFVDQVLAALARTGANPQNLKLELTESMLVDNIEDVIAKMADLKFHGIGFSLDDFGTGYSSLCYLKRLPLEQLKIDRSFVRDIVENVSSRAIAQSIISLGAAMCLSVIAEGVETEEQRVCLSQLGCRAFQGYLFSRPLPLEEFQLWALGFAEVTPRRSENSAAHSPEIPSCE